MNTTQTIGAIGAGTLGTGKTGDATAEPGKKEWIAACHAWCVPCRV
jgi:hypothetical protein